MRQMGGTEIVASGSRKRYQGGNHVQSRRRQEVDEAVRDMLVCTMWWYRVATSGRGSPGDCCTDDGESVSQTDGTPQHTNGAGRPCFAG